jgi:hypothetical protein
MGYGGAQFSGGRAEGALEELTHDLPCDFLVLDGYELDLSDVLVPTAGGPSSDLSAEVACALRETLNVDVSLLHVTDPGGEMEGEAFLREWAESQANGHMVYNRWRLLGTHSDTTRGPRDNWSRDREWLGRLS